MSVNRVLERSKKIVVNLRVCGSGWCWSGLGLRRHACKPQQPMHLLCSSCLLGLRQRKWQRVFFFISSIEVYITYPTLSFLVSFQTQRDNMDFEFAIPINLTDLQTKQSLTDYCVSEVFPARILPNKLAGESVYPMMYRWKYWAWKAPSLRGMFNQHLHLLIIPFSGNRLSQYM